MFEAVHTKRYAERMTAYLGLGVQSHVIEVASSDGSLLQQFSRLGIPVIGIERDHAAAVRAMMTRGIPTLTGSFGRDMARRLAAEGIDADLMVANNALSHVADIDDFLDGFTLLLNPEGVATFEVSRASCLSPQMAEQLFSASGLRIFDVEPLDTQDGSLQLFACRSDAAWQSGPWVGRTLAMERPVVH
ncbi:MAG: methyltransferase domain-containing protein [Rhodospirillales bacterium]|nr:methyltransferase domain-containing protein [Rhodospirillales bacterium]